jgi:hypothetical protein
MIGGKRIVAAFQCSVDTLESFAHFPHRLIESAKLSLEQRESRGIIGRGYQPIVLAVGFRLLLPVAASGQYR